MQIPRYELPTHSRFELGGRKVHAMKIIDFLGYIINRDKLSVNQYLDRMGQDAFFLVAATGLGKTVAVPVHVLIRLMQVIGLTPNPDPRVWVVEPRIPIAVDQAAFMNSLWWEYLRAKGDHQHAPLFGCISSSSGRVNPDAPIQFVTTGIFELMAKGSELSPKRDRVVIDEAHVTLEQNPGVELGIALAKKAGVTVDYMSATVDVATLGQDLGVGNVIRADAQRHVVWKANLHKPLDEVLEDLVDGTLVNPDPQSAYFPQVGEFAYAQEVVQAVLEPGRSHGMLLTVNSFAGEHSDIARLADLIRKRFSSLPVLELASEVIRDAARERAFRNKLREIEAARQNYVILATSVVEMGITFPTLDYVVTMDCGYEQETIGDAMFPVVAPLGINSLLQRIGRVGRKRPGIAYIANEVGANYAELESDELNRPGALEYQPIRYPLATAPLMPLAYYVCGQEWGKGLTTWLAELDLPSKLPQNSVRMEHLEQQLDMLQSLGLSDQDDKHTPFGKRMERWVGLADLVYAVQLQRRFEAGCDLPELAFWLVATALSNTPPTALRQRHGFFVDYREEHRDIAHRMNPWRGYGHEDLSIFNVLCSLAEIVPVALFGGRLTAEVEDVLSRFCNWNGLELRNWLKAAKTIDNTWRLFCRINGKTERFAELFGGHKPPELAKLSWYKIISELPVGDVHEHLVELSGVVRLEWQEEMIYPKRGKPISTGWFSWRVPGHDDQQGRMRQDSSPVRLLGGRAYFARLVPSRRAEGDDAEWRLAHLSLGEDPNEV